MQIAAVVNMLSPALSCILDILESEESKEK